MRYGIDERVEVEGGQVGIFGFDEDHVGRVVPGQVDFEGIGVVQVGKGDAVLGADGLANDDLVNVVELVPVLFVGIDVFDERLKFWTARYRDIERLGRKKRLQVEQVEVVVVEQVGEQLVAQPIQIGEHGQRQVPAAVRGAVDAEFGAL
ncbi:hypothetical protein BpHYR1_029176 [Brachionus plicatilis]|uniref:Uncharacterized protein n=1 Tax=Brachionus plicatilis TaxID=10195 RepID=A0A3M7T4D4_BRAPC|nr:hypothetical protein BpHYR1_029176 [Brachionus plicatilis]